MDGPISSLLGFFHTYGYLTLFFGVMFENAGIPLPGETILLLAGFLAWRGELAIALVIAVAACGAVLGDNLGYWLGSIGGRPLLERYGRYAFLTARRIQTAERYFARYGAATVYFARFIAGLRVLGAFLAGVSHMHYPKFFVFNLLGAISWATAMGLLGYFLGHSWQALVADVKRIDFALAIAAALIIIFIVIRRWIARKREKRLSTDE